MLKFIAKVMAGAIIALAVLSPSQALADKSKGQFIGASNHITTGGVTILKTADGGAVVVLDSDFSLDGAPDPHVGFGLDGTYDEATDLGLLTSNTGVQVFIVPASINLDNFNQVYIWCKEFGVPLGLASLR